MYGESLHADHRGEWTYDLAWKPLAGFPVRAGWLDAIRAGQRRLRAGLDIHGAGAAGLLDPDVPGQPGGTTAALADAVLDVEHMVRWAPRLGRHVTLVRFDGGMHDLTLSGPAVREQVFAEAGRWAEAFLRPARPPPTPTARRSRPRAGLTGRYAARRGPAAGKRGRHSQPDAGET